MGGHKRLRRKTARDVQHMRKNASQHGTQHHYDYYGCRCAACVQGKCAQQRDYRYKNRARLQAQARKYVKMRRRTNPIYAIATSIRKRLWRVLKGELKSAHSHELVGCSFADLRNHLEQQFTSGMTWDNYGKWHIDHKTPCAAFNLSHQDQLRACFHYQNLQPLWRRDNQSKGCRI